MQNYQPEIPYRLSKPLRLLLAFLGGVLLLVGVALLAGWLDAPLSRFIAEALRREPKPGWPAYFRKGGMVLLTMGILLLLLEQFVHGFNRVLRWGSSRLEAVERWLEKKTSGLFDMHPAQNSGWRLSFNHWDAAILAFFLFIAIVFQFAGMSPGYPTVILGGDAANIASFAAGRAFPELFRDDAILGDLKNIGLYVTIHLPLTIWLEKLVGNFGLAYSLLLLPHVFLHYFSYYLLGRVLFAHRYWAFLFSLAISAPIFLDGGELWGVMGDAMPRFTFQILIPFIFILLLSAWREKPGRWYWVMVIVGLMAFIHPVSTPTFAFALWLGFWPMFPPAWDARRKLVEMLKLGAVLVLAILPYASIYLAHHQSGSNKSSYDLVYYILVEYFPTNILNIPGAIHTLFSNTARFGLLWYGLAGLILTFLLFRSARPRLEQMLVWIAGIAFVSILIPWIEITIERTLRLIPLQTELMRGMRYLVPFLFVFWFYPFAELTRRSVHRGLSSAVFIIGTLLTLGWLLVNPPEPFRQSSYVFQCWSTGRLICPSNVDHADALTYIREGTPEGSTFAVFLTNRWSGIEVRYLGLRPMVYAYKDKGQLLFTNLESLEQWHAYQQRENEIFSPRKTPTLEEKRAGIVEFARQAGADYILTDFPFPAEAQRRLNVIAVYQNSTYSILENPAPLSLK